jgi:hypothetical protein
MFGRDFGKSGDKIIASDSGCPPLIKSTPETKMDV